MTAPHDLDRQLNAFLLDGPTELPDASFDAVRDHIEDTRQRVGIGPWRFPDMSKFAAIGLGAAAVVVAVIIGSRLLGTPASTGVGGPPAPSATPAATPSPTPDGFLPVGSHTIVDTGDPSAPVRIAVTIPSSGWNAHPEFGGIGKGLDGDPPEASMVLWSWPAGTDFDVYRDPCEWNSTKPTQPATTVDEIATALAAQASRDASDPVDVTVGGYAGKHITLHVPNDAPNRAEAFADCYDDTFAMYGKTGSGPSRFNQGPGQVDELWILDVGGNIVILDAMYRKASGTLSDTPAALIEELRSIAESASFVAP